MLVKCIVFIDFALNRIFVEMFRRNVQAGKLLLESSEASAAWLRARYIGLILITVSILCITQHTMPRHCVIAVQPIVSLAKSTSKPKLEPKLYPFWRLDTKSQVTIKRKQDASKVYSA